MNLKKIKQHNAFTFAEVLITLGVIGVVAAVTMPTLLTNIQDRVRQEQVRTVKYKLTKATNKMNSLGKIKQYDTTMDFVNELEKHMTIAKICDNTELDKCWPSSEINAYSGSGTTLTAYNPKDLTTGQSLKALALSTKSTQTVGIVTGDGVPMLMVYSPSPSCNEFDEAKTYTWSVENGKSVTNATTNCISAIFDINGSKGPNKIGTDVRTLNSLFGSTNLGSSYNAVGVDICNKMKQKHGIKYCNGRMTVQNLDKWVGAIYACDKLGLHLPTSQTLGSYAGTIYGISDVDSRTSFLSPNFFGDCETVKNSTWGQEHSYLFTEGNVICGKIFSYTQLALGTPFNGNFYSNEEISDVKIIARGYNSNGSYWFKWNKDAGNAAAFCVGD